MTPGDALHRDTQRRLRARSAESARGRLRGSAQAGAPPPIVCACHAPGCLTCEQTGGCGWQACAPCADFGYTRPSRRATQAGYLETFVFGSHVDAVVVSTMFNPRAGADCLTASIDLNTATAQLAKTSVLGVVPFVTILPSELGNQAASPVQDAEVWLSQSGFQGIGELFIHGHHENYQNDVTSLGDNLVAVCHLAHKYDVPIHVHWDFGRVDGDVDSSGNPITADDNWNQLIALLDQFNTSEYADTPLKFVLAHCGVGPAGTDDPDDYGNGGMSNAEFGTWLERFNLLLTDYSWVYFDLAGMQLGSPGVVPDVETLLTWVNPVNGEAAGPFLRTSIGDAIREAFLSQPSRFLMGTDVNNEFATSTTIGTTTYPGVDVYADSVEYYLRYLAYLTDDAGKLAQLTHQNALDLLGLTAWPHA